MLTGTRIEIRTIRCFDAPPRFTDEIGKYFSYICGDSDRFFPPVYSVMDDFGNLIPVEF